MVKFKFNNLILVGAIIITGITITQCSKSDNIVARYTTKMHYRYSPVSMDGDIYFPSNKEISNPKNQKILGMLGTKEESSLNDKLLLVGGVYVSTNDTENTHFIVEDDNQMTYSKASYLENLELTKTNLDKYEKFALCTEKNDIESRINIDKNLVLNLEKDFGAIEYNLKDFDNADDSYFIYVDSPSEKIHEMTFDNPIIYVGTVFVKNSKLYYGNLQNEITGELYNKLLKLIS